MTGSGGEEVVVYFACLLSHAEFFAIFIVVLLP